MNKTPEIGISVIGGNGKKNKTIKNKILVTKKQQTKYEQNSLKLESFIRSVVKSFCSRFLK